MGLGSRLLFIFYNLFSVGCETLLPFASTTPESIADCGRGPDLYDDKYQDEEVQF